MNFDTVFARLLLHLLILKIPRLFCCRLKLKRHTKTFVQHSTTTATLHLRPVWWTNLTRETRFSGERCSFPAFSLFYTETTEVFQRWQHYEDHPTIPQARTISCVNIESHFLVCHVLMHPRLGCSPISSTKEIILNNKYIVTNIFPCAHAVDRR